MLEAGAKVLSDHANGTPYCPDFFEAGFNSALTWARANDPEVLELVELLRETNKYLDLSPNQLNHGVTNAICTGSILHKKFKEALDAWAESGKHDS